MSSSLRILPRVVTRTLRSHQTTVQKAAFSIAPRLCSASSTRGPPPAPAAEAAALRDGKPPTYLGTAKRLPEFNLVDKVVLVSGAARGLGLVQAEALLEAGATGTLPPAFCQNGRKARKEKTADFEPLD